MSEELNKTSIPKTVLWYNLRREFKGKSIEIGGNAPKKLRFGGGCTRAAGVGSPAEQYQEPLGLRLPSKADAFSADILDLNELLVKRPAATYFVRVEGDKQGTGNKSSINFKEAK